MQLELELELETSSPGSALLRTSYVAAAVATDWRMEEESRWAAFSAHSATVTVPGCL